MAAYVSQYKQPIIYSRVHVVDLPKLTDKVTADIELARNWKAETLNGKLSKNAKRYDEEAVSAAAISQSQTFREFPY